MSKFLNENGLNYLISKYKSIFKTDRLDITNDSENYFHVNVTDSGSVQMVVEKGQFKLKSNSGNLVFEPHTNARISANYGNIIMNSKEGILINTDNVAKVEANQFMLASNLNSELTSNGSKLKLGSDSRIDISGDIAITANPRIVINENHPEDSPLYLYGNIDINCNRIKTNTTYECAINTSMFKVQSIYDDYPHSIIKSGFNRTVILSFLNLGSGLHALLGELIIGKTSSLRGNDISMKFCDDQGEFEEEFSMRNVICKNIDNILDKELPLNERFVKGSMRELLTSRCFVGGCPVKIIPGNMCAWIVCERIDDSKEFSNEYTIVTEYYKITSGYDDNGNDVIKYANVYMKKTNNISAEDATEDGGDIEEQA